MATMKKKTTKTSKSLKKYEDGGNNMPTRAGRILRSMFPGAYGINTSPLGPGIKGKIGYGAIQGAKPSGGKPLEAAKKGGSTKSKSKLKSKKK